MKSQSGFTLIEMVAVIIILAIMAATAMPRFVNMSGDARLSALQGMVAATNSARALVQSKWSLANSANQANVDLGGGFSVSTISFAQGRSSPNLYGIPVAEYTSGIWSALDNPTGFSSALVAAGGAAAITTGLPGTALWPNGVATSSTCYMFYDSSGVVTLVTSTVANTLPDPLGCL